MTNITKYQRGDFLAGYVECAEWADAPTGDDGNEAECLPLQGDELARLEAEAADWLEENAIMLARAVDEVPGYTWARAGHDFWLTRQGHGTGFWDRGLPDDVIRALTESARLAGSLYLYVGDDGFTYVGGV